jgi:hypothetical protein
MSDKYTYEYSVIRLVPRVEREEFINIGIMLYCKLENYLKVRFSIDEPKILAIHPKMDLEVLDQYVKVIEASVAYPCQLQLLKNMDVSSKFRWLSARKSTMIQYAPIHIGQSDDLDKTLDSLVDLLVS